MKLHDSLPTEVGDGLNPKSQGPHFFSVTYIYTPQIKTLLAIVNGIMCFASHLVLIIDVFCQDSSVANIS